MTWPHLSDALPQLATTKEIAEYLGVSEATVIIKCRRRQLPAVKVGHRWLINVQVLAATIVAAATSPEPPVQSVAASAFKVPPPSDGATARGANPPSPPRSGGPGRSGASQKGGAR